MEQEEQKIGEIALPLSSRTGRPRLGWLVGRVRQRVSRVETYPTLSIWTRGCWSGVERSGRGGGRNPHIVITFHSLSALEPGFSKGRSPSLLVSWWHLVRSGHLVAYPPHPTLLIGCLDPERPLAFCSQNLVAVPLAGFSGKLQLRLLSFTANPPFDFTYSKRKVLSPSPIVSTRSSSGGVTPLYNTFTTAGYPRQ